MLFLIRDILLDLTDIGLTDRECPIAALPMKVAQPWPFFLDAGRRTGLNLLDQLRNRDRTVKVAKNVDVIFHNPDDQRRALDIPKRADEVACHDAAKFRFTQERLPMFRAKDNMQQDVGKRLRHWGSPSSIAYRPVGPFLTRS